jgi:hypothetical protein
MIDPVCGGVPGQKPNARYEMGHGLLNVKSRRGFRATQGAAPIHARYDANF